MKAKIPSKILHGYVDECLTDSERKAFESCLCEDRELSLQVETWRAQRDALRLAFGAVAEGEPAPAEMKSFNGNSERLSIARVEAFVSARARSSTQGRNRAPARNWTLFVACRVASLALMTIVFVTFASATA